MDSYVEDTTTAPLLISVGITLQLITIFLVTARMWTRLHSGKTLQLHDWTVLFAEILSFPQLVLLVDATFYGYGRHQRFVSIPNIAAATRNVFISQVIWYWSATLAKTSIACLLLSLKHERRWRIFLYSTLALLFAALILITLTQFLACDPLAAYWDPALRRTASCWNFRAIEGNVIAFSCAQVLTDIVFSFIPLTFIRHLHRPRRDKIVLTILMGLGILASGTAIARTIIGTVVPKDRFRNDSYISLLAMVDLHVGIMAATLPTLKVFLESLLVRVVEFYKDEKSEEEVRKVLVELGLLDTTYERDYNGKWDVSTAVRDQIT